MKTAPTLSFTVPTTAFSGKDGLSQPYSLRRIGYLLNSVTSPKQEVMEARLYVSCNRLGDRSHADF